jgi:hypothetical protein
MERRSVFSYQPTYISTDTLQQFYFNEFDLNGPENELLQGLINGAPYLCSALIGCWCNAPMNVGGGSSLIINLIVTD